jgi:outer membrane protein
MKNASIILSSIALIGVIALFAIQFSGKDSKPAKSAAHTTTSSSGRIAYVNIDSLEANYNYLKTKREEFQRKQESMRAELQQSERQMQNDLVAYQRKAQAGTLTQAEGEAAEKRLMQMQQSLKTREASLTEQLLKEQEDFNVDLHKRLDSYLADYNKDKGFDYILSYSRSGSIMYANPALDITADVIDGMNKLSAADTKAK